MKKTLLLPSLALLGVLVLPGCGQRDEDAGNPGVGTTDAGRGLPASTGAPGQTSGGVGGGAGATGSQQGGSVPP